MMETCNLDIWIKFLFCIQIGIYIVNVNRTTKYGDAVLNIYIAST